MKRTNNTGSKQTEALAIEAFKSSGYLIVNKTLMKKFGMVNAVILSNYVDKDIYFKNHKPNNNGWFFLTYKEQQNQLNIGLHSLKKAKSFFSDLGIIQTKRAGVPAKEWFKIDYQKLVRAIGLVNMNSCGLEDMNSDGLEDMNSCGHIRRPNYNETKFKESSSSENNKNGLITPSQFEKFWEMYPKKVDKGKAKTIWDRICRRQQNRPKWRELSLALAEQKRSERWQNKKFIPHPSTWLNQNRWLDDPNEMRSYDYSDDNKNNKPSNFYTENTKYF